MEFDVFWLLALPLFFALGWLAARHEARSRAVRPPLPDAYFRGLNFLLNDQSDRAVDAFVDVVRIDPETIELHFALGKLFRRRGETDRAIRVHQNLLGRTDLDPELREQALYELAQDFLKAGLLDRADQAFERLASGPFTAQAVRHRIEIAETMRDWARAIELAGKVSESELSDTDRVRLTHFHCERAARALAGSDSARLVEAERHLEGAQRHARHHPRVTILLGELALAHGDLGRAIEVWRDLLATAPAHFNLVAARWVDAHRQLGRLDQAVEALDRQWAKLPSVELFLQGFAARLEQGRDPSELANWAAEMLGKSPSFAGLAQWLKWQSGAGSRAMSAELRLSERLVSEQARLQSRHLCSQCGFRAQQYFWRCPGCGSWDTVSPLRAEDPNQ
jgi:lipopolysaccharide biosynthesis regulator YciM